MGVNLDRFSGDGPAPDNATDVAQMVERCNGLLDDLRYTFAVDTIEGIRATCQARGYVTGEQRRAITNIETSVQEREDRPRGGSRRYEGWHR